LNRASKVIIFGVVHEAFGTSRARGGLGSVGKVISLQGLQGLQQIFFSPKSCQLHTDVEFLADFEHEIKNRSTTCKQFQEHHFLFRDAPSTDLHLWHSRPEDIADVLLERTSRQKPTECEFIIIPFLPAL